jgi:hypothetical protein
MISCEPGEGLTTECGLARRGLPTEQKQKLSGRKLLLTVRLPLTRLAPVALGTLSHKGRGKKAATLLWTQNPGSAATMTLMVPETSAIRRSVLES